MFINFAYNTINIEDLFIKSTHHRKGGGRGCNNGFTVNYHS